ncbi:MAG: S-isoprenylcysteine methyltransferase [Gammaproteobacteria bacterium]|nr:S-isoprenylcysteine methyltransferase [Gammaproteobacteria bacterium]
MLIHYGQFLFRYRNILFPIVLVTLLFSFNPVPFAGNEYADFWLDLAGLLLIFLGQALRAAVIGLAYIKRGGVNKKIHANNLVTQGIFSHCRNPLYTGNLIILSGFMVIHNNLWVYLLGGSFFLLSYSAIITAEEAFLRNNFGEEFNQYCNNVHRWLFRLRGVRLTLNSMQFNWRRVILKDYTTLLTWLITVLVLFAEEHIVLHGLENSLMFITRIAIAIIFAILMALFIRSMKKSGALAE